MKKIEHLILLIEIDKQIRSLNTGNPDVFAKKLGVSSRKLFYILARFKELGASFKYHRRSETYYYTEPIDLEISAQLKINDGPSTKIVNLLNLF